MKKLIVVSCLSVAANAFAYDLVKQDIADLSPTCLSQKIAQAPSAFNYSGIKSVKDSMSPAAWNDMPPRSVPVDFTGVKFIDSKHIQSQTVREIDNKAWEAKSKTYEVTVNFVPGVEYGAIPVSSLVIYDNPTKPYMYFTTPKDPDTVVKAMAANNGFAISSTSQIAVSVAKTGITAIGCVNNGEVKVSGPEAFK